MWRFIDMARIRMFHAIQILAFLFFFFFKVNYKCKSWWIISVYGLILWIFMVAIFLEKSSSNITMSMENGFLFLFNWMAFSFFLTGFPRRITDSDNLYLVRCAAVVAGHCSSACEEQSHVHVLCLLFLLWVAPVKWYTLGRFLD